MKEKGNSILIIDDDKNICKLVSIYLKNEGFEVSAAHDGPEGIKAFKEISPALILLDIMLPGEDGFAILSRLKDEKTTAHIPVIMVSAKGEEVSKVRGLNMGADDYIAKPFGILELIARIKANLRKSAKEAAGSVAYKDIVIDHSMRRVTVNGVSIKTTLKEYNLLRLLCENPEKVQTREKIFDLVWDSNFAGETRTLDIHIKELRKKISGAGSGAVIQTVRGVGYMLT